MLSSADNCPTGVDHAVVIVGYEPGAIIWKKRLVCEWMTWQEYLSGQCLSDYYFKVCKNPVIFDDIKFAKQSSKDFSINDRSIKPIDEKEIEPIFDDEIVDPWSCSYRCCRWEWYATQGEDVWLIQNSWGTGWGDSGFIRLKNEGGVGVSGMNQYIKWVTVV